MATSSACSDAPRCSDLEVEPLAGSAKRERVYVLLEWPHGWSRDILDGGVFGDELTAKLKKKLANTAGLQLIRHPGRDGRKITCHHLFLVFAAEAVVERLMVSSPEAILDLDLSGPGRNGAETVAHPLVLICTHGKRDVCCALKGRPLAAELAQRHSGEVVWETSHTKGHRFAPSILLMPWGYSFGRLNVEAADGLVNAALAGQWFHPGNRGRGLYGPRAQVAEVAVGKLLSDARETLRYGDLSVVDQAADPVVIAHADGRSWKVWLEQQEVSGIVSSCGDQPKIGKVWVATKLESLALG
ncbi:sucrase ferredoxin [Corynebacterium alimapuense]|uniref:Sucrase ferredoxin n=1 Tax=Corynebacterium alimapuense TaxID=1576874 RepID=A0A3M8K8J1_9CORY|nr:sucrase ferredoxin [Corynebacterium alimapuense]RNE48824.1 sucrase ferredoxin [Corynebacterium alimapuense]